MRRVASILIICLLVATGVYVLRPRPRPAVVVEDFLWALDRGDLDAATRSVHPGYAEKVRSAAAEGAGTNHAIARVTVKGDPWSWDYAEVNATIHWKNGKASPGFERLFRGQVLDGSTDFVWHVVFSLERQVPRGWVIRGLVGGG